MHQTSFLHLIKTLSDTELAGFHKFLYTYSTLEQTQKLSLWTYIYYKHFKKEDFDSDQLKKAALAKRQGVDLGRIRLLLSALHKHLKNYLVWLKMKEDEALRFHFLVESLLERNNLKEANIELKKANKLHAQQTVKDANFFYTQHLLMYDNYNFAQHQNNRQATLNIQDIIYYLDDYYWIQKLKYTCVLLNNTDILVNTTLDLDINHLLAQITETRRNSAPVVDIYYHLLLVLSGKHTSAISETWEQLLKLIHNNSENTLHINDIETIINLSLNYCIRQFRLGNEAYLPSQLALYKIMLQKGILTPNQQLAIHHYKNLVRLACRVKDFKWAITFTSDYQHYLPTENQTNYYHLNYAAIAFYQQNYELALAHLREVKKMETHDHLNINMLYLKTYYSLIVQQKAQHYEQPLNDLIHTFKVYFLRNKTAARINFKEYQNFLRFFKHFLGIREQLPYKQDTHKLRERLIKLKLKIETAKVLVDKQWLLEQVKTLLSNA